MLLPYLNENLIEAGCDEAGRGCLAGSVYAAAVILPKDFKNELLNDSKQLTEKQRYALREVIEREAIAWAVGIVSPEEIDEINILRASFLDFLFHAHLFRENMVHRHFLSLKRRLFCSLHFYFFLMYLPIVPLAAIKITICRLNQYSTYILYMTGFIAQLTIRNPSTII